ACLRESPCGTATDANGISKVEYKLQRSTWMARTCWEPEAYFGAGLFTPGACGDYRTAELTGPANSVIWKMPAGASGTFLIDGTYTLSVRVTDNASPTKAVTERVLRFTIT